jgi:undecaprenyl-diphosphatase
VSGASNINTIKFLTTDLLSSFVWAFISITIGFIFGKSFEKASSFIGSFILIATVIAVLIILAVNYAKKRNIKIPRTDVFVFTSSIISVYLFSLIAQNIHRGQVFGILDTRIFTLHPIIHTPLLDTIMITITSVGGGVFLTFISILLFLYIYFKRSKQNAIVLGTILISGYLALEILKNFFHRMRPVGIIDVPGYSFPSGHATMSMIYFVLITYFWFRHVKNIYHKNILIGIAFTLSIMIGLSRVYLVVHYTSDVLAGFLFGIFYATFIIVIFKGTRLIVKKTKIDHELPLP